MPANTDQRQVLSRRTALTTGAALLAGGGAVALWPEGTRAQVTIDSFAAQDASFERETLTPAVTATLAYDYDVGDASVSGLQFTLGIDGSEVASDVLTTDRTALTGETDLSGTVTDSEAWSASDFEPAVAETVSREVAVSVTFAVLDPSDAAIVSASAADTASLTVSHPQDSEYVAAVGGEATFSASES